jgi:uncharacterized protein (TIGR03000 family)
MYGLVFLAALGGGGLSVSFEGGIPDAPAPWRVFPDSGPTAGNPGRFAGAYRPAAALARPVWPAAAPRVVYRDRVVYVPVYRPARSDAGRSPATVVVRLPAGARLTIDGRPTRATGATRRFVSPPLQPGKTYTYRLRAEMGLEGRTVSATQTVTVQAGRRSQVQFGLSEARVTGARAR